MLRRGLNRESIKKVIDAIKESPKNWTELKEENIPDKSLQRILKEYLSYWGLITQDEYGRWCWYEDIRTFDTRHEYELALYHSRRIVLSSEGNIRYDEIDPFLTLDTLAILDKKLLSNDDDKKFLDHLKTGYPETYETLMAYREKLNQVGFFTKEEVSKPYLGSLDYDFESPAERVQIAASFRTGLTEISEWYSNYDQEKIAELFNMRDLLVGRIYSIINSVSHNIPLKGHCDYCPRIRILD